MPIFVGANFRQNGRIISKEGARVQRESLDLVSLAIRSIPLGVIGDAISKRQRLLPYDHPPL